MAKIRFSPDALEDLREIKSYLTDDLHASGFTPNYVTEHEAFYTKQGKNIHFLIAKMMPVSGALNIDKMNGGNYNG